MTTKISSILKGFGISMTAAALMLSVAPSSHTVSADHHAASVAAIDPDTFHHWEVTTAVADLDPSTFHHWEVTTTAVADLDPLTFHHWA